MIIFQFFFDNVHVILPLGWSGWVKANERHRDLQNQCPTGCEKHNDGMCWG